MKYTVRDYYSFNEFITFETSSIPVQLTEYEDLPFKHFELNEEGIKTTIKINSDMKYDGYLIKILPTKELYLEAHSKRALIYAWNVLETLVIKNKDTLSLPIALIEDYPSVALRGIIEGFYYEPWSQADRLDMVDFCVENRLNTYMYAPKADQYHRQEWRTLYPNQEFDNLCQVIRKCQSQDVDFYYCISPGLDFKFTLESDFEALYQKLEQVIKVGVKHFALLMDDIDYKLDTEDEQRFERPGLAHAYIANKINAYLKNRLEKFSYVMCPTEYWQNYDTEYRRDLKENMDLDIEVFWTGYNTVAEVIDEKDCKIVQESFGHDLILWDNYPVNDMAQCYLFMGPLVNRASNLGQYHKGMLTNPMNQWHLSKVPMVTMAMYMWNTEKYQPEEAYGLAINQTIDEPFRRSYKTFCDHNKTSLIARQDLDGLQEAIEIMDYLKLDAYFAELSDAAKKLRDINHPDLLDEMNGWLKRIVLDEALYEALKNKNIILIKKLLNTIKNHPYEIGTNMAMRIAHRLGYIEEKDVYQYKRNRFWRM